MISRAHKRKVWQAWYKKNRDRLIKEASERRRERKRIIFADPKLAAKFRQERNAVWRKTVAKMLKNPIRAAKFKATKKRCTKTLAKKLKTDALAAYGTVCQCPGGCGEHRQEFLTIDHIGGGGKAHRDEIGNGGGRLYRWLRDHKYPPGFRTLCWNGNCAIGAFGKCPHEVERAARR